MPRKKVISASKAANKPDYNNLQVNDVLCPICRTILLEPVTLPCNHTFCYVCFNDTMENANLVCPLCRLRVGSWLRGAKKDKKLINDVLWTAIKKQYHKEVQNKYSGIENDFEDDKPVIVVSNPGEIRKEYEIQKQKDDDELRKLQEAEELASEELIRRIREEEEYKLAVEEEKMKLDLEIAKKLANQLVPSTSKMGNSKKGKKYGPMDKFITNDHNKLNNSKTLNSTTNSFATKEYTCRVICLDKETKSNTQKNNLYKNSVVPVFQKKIQQIQKILENEEACSRSRDSKSGSSSDIIESEYKFYFKPINFQNNPPAQPSCPIKIPCKKLAVGESSAKVVPPSGMICFQSNILESAFARISLQYSQTEKTELIKSPSTAKSQSPLKRTKRREPCSKSPPKKTAKTSLTKEIFLQKNQNSKSESPPFYGYDSSPNKIGSGARSVEHVDDDVQAQKLLQEQADYEFAKRLQEELNSAPIGTRSRRTV